MHRTLLGSALVAIWQYLILAGGPHPGDPDPLGLESKSCEQKLQQIGAYLQEIGVLSAATNTARLTRGAIQLLLRSRPFLKALDLDRRYALPTHPARRGSFGVGRYVVCRVTTEPGEYVALQCPYVATWGVAGIV